MRESAIESPGSLLALLGRYYCGLKIVANHDGNVFNLTDSVETMKHAYIFQFVKDPSKTQQETHCVCGLASYNPDVSAGLRVNIIPGKKQLYKGT